MPPPRRKNPFAKAVLAPRIPPPGQPLTQIQLKILDAIKKISTEKGYPPSVRDVMKEVGLLSSSTVQRQLDILQKAGYVTRDKRVPRSIRLVVPPASPPGGDAA